MKKKIKVLGLLLFAFVCLNAQTPYFFYYDGEKQYLELDTRHFFISVTDETTVSRAFASFDAKHEPLRIDIPEGKLTRTNQNRRFWSVLSFENRLSEKEYFAKLSEIKNSENGIIVAPSFKDRYQNRISMSNFFYVKLKELADTTLLRRKAEREHAIIMWQNEFMPLWFVLSVTASSKYNAMELSNNFYESGLFQYAEPDLFTDDDKSCVDDPEFWQQWALSNTIQSGGTTVDIKACAAWQIATGQGVTVAVFDQGYLLNNRHPDLDANLLPNHLSFDSDSRSSPQRHYGSHGIPCMGIIGAARNNIGIVGVAYNSKIMSISTSLAGNTLNRDSRQHGINWAVANGADVISNSWDWTPAAPSAYVRDAINNAVQNGRERNGVPLGVVIVFSTGNNSSTSVNFPGNLANVIAVGAIERNGNRARFSNHGIELNVVAPGNEIFTTNWQGGYSNFGGTSAACPHVAGVAALILSVNPNLTWQQVKNIIESTAQQVGGYNYYSDPNRPGWNFEMGYGLVNAYAAVRAAACVNSFINQTISINRIITACSGSMNIGNITITNNAILTIIAPDGVNFVGDVNIESGDLVIQ